MNLSDKLRVSCKVLKAVVFKRRFPFVVTWNLTYKCNLQCKYCGAWEKKAAEMKTKDVFAAIDEFVSLGSQFIKFTGGESLLREDIGEIIDFCRRKNLRILLNSNGTLIKERIEKIKNIEEIQLSLDGPRDVHDYIRGRGVHDKVLEAIDVCKDNNIGVILTTVISRYNISFIPYILNIAQKYKVGVYFQPVTQDMSNNCKKDISLFFSPDEREYKRVVTFLINEKKRGNRFISHSLSGLRHLYHWPQPQKVNCLQGLICCFVEPDGRMFICNMFPSYERYLVPVRKSFEKAFDSLSIPYSCAECWASDVEVNLLQSLKVDTMLSMWKRFSKQ